MNKIFLALALTATLFSAESERKLPPEVEQKRAEIQQLRAAHRAAMEVKIEEMRVILQKYPELKERFEQRIEKRKDMIGPRNEKNR